MGKSFSGPVTCKWILETRLIKFSLGGLMGISRVHYVNNTKIRQMTRI